MAAATIRATFAALGAGNGRDQSIYRPGQAGE
jgi:hypothetical protein